MTQNLVLKILKIKKLVVIIFVIILIFELVYSSEIHPNAGTTSASFLKIPVGARASSMGGYYAMVGDDVSLLYWNSAGVAKTSFPQVEFSHKEYFQSLKHEFFGYMFPVKNAVVGFGVTTLFADGIEGRSGVLDLNDAYVNLYQVTSPEYYFGILDLAINGTYAKRLTNQISIGISPKFILQKVDTYSGYSFAIDFGLNWFLKKNLVLGTVVKNFGLPIKLDKESYSLPLEFGVGVGYEYNNTKFVFNLCQPIDNYLITSIGIEHNVLEHIFLRAGYRYRLYGWELGDDAGLSAGVGVNYYGIKMDYGIVSYGELGFVHNVSIGIEFDKIGNVYKKIREKFAKIFLQKGVSKDVVTDKKVQKKDEVLKPLSVNSENSNDSSKPQNNFVDRQYILSAQTQILSYDPTNKFYLYNFFTIEPLILQKEDEKELVLKKVEGEIYSRNKVDVTKNQSVLINSFVEDESIKSMLPINQKVVKIIEIDKYLNSEVSNLVLYFSKKNYDNLQFFVFDKGLQKVSFETVVLEDDVLYKINLPKNLKIVIVE